MTHTLRYTDEQHAEILRRLRPRVVATVNAGEQPTPKSTETAKIEPVGRAKRKSATKYPIAALCRAAGLPEPIAEYQFAKPRRWRFDFAWSRFDLGAYHWGGAGLALEIDGGLWTQGRHTRGSGRLKDMAKFNEAALMGWRILYVTPQQVKDGTALGLLLRALK